MITQLVEVRAADSDPQWAIALEQKTQGFVCLILWQSFSLAQGSMTWYIISEHHFVGLFQFNSVRIILITYFSTVVPLASCDFFSVDLSSLTRHFQLNL